MRDETTGWHPADELLKRSQSEAQLVNALIAIALSYDWEPYEDDETVIKSGVIDGKVIREEFPTNRRIARETLADLMIDY